MSCLDRFMVAVNVTKSWDGIGEMTDLGVESAIAELHKAIPVAKSIAMFGNALDADSEPLQAYIRQQCAAIDAKPDEPSFDRDLDKLIAEQRCLYFTALALGLILADQV